MTNLIAPEGEGLSPEGASRRPAHRALRYAVAALLIGLLLYRVDWTDASHELSQISAGLLAGAFVAMAIGLAVSAWKWSWALRLHDLHCPYLFLLRTLCIGFFFNGFLPTAVGGDAYRVLRTLPLDGYRSRALSAVVVERAMGFLALIVLGGVGALWLAPHYPVAREYWYILLGLAILGVSGFLALEAGWLHRISHHWAHLSAVNLVQHNLGLLRHRRTEWLGLIAGSFAFQLISVGAIFVLFSAVGMNATPAQCALIGAAVGVAAALPLSVNGVGVMEGALVAMAVALEIDYEQALIVAFTRRALALCLAIPCGALWLTDTREVRPADRTAGFVGLLRIFRRSGFRAVLDAAQPSAPPRSSATVTLKALIEPDVPLTEDVLDTERWETHLLEYTHDAITIWEMSGQGIVYWNRGAEQLYGYSRAEARGRTTHELLKTQLAGGVTHLERSLARFGIWAGELRHTTSCGNAVVVEARLTLMSQHNGRWLVLEVNRDITDRKVAEAASRAIERQLAELRANQERDRQGTPG